jgi:NAD(P)-dependent dehydrogenase (short-subunit alcohol dehydrogenase family)
VTQQNSVPKLAIVTGGSRGLGRNTALNLAKRGVDVILTYHTNQAEAESAVAAIEAMERKAVALPLDVGNTGSFDGFTDQVKQALAQTWGRDRFDYLVNNAGVAAPGLVAQMAEADFDRLVDIHFKGVFFLTQKLLPLIADGGRIVNISSGLARVSMPGYAAYGALKGAVEVLTRYMAQELGPRGITVNVVAPGAIETDFGGGHLRANPELQKRVAGITALGRVGQPDDIGPMIAALLTDENRWVNAQRIEVSGGMSL